MAPKDFVVRDSSIKPRISASTLAAATAIDASVKTGFIQSSHFDTSRGETVYIVEVMIKGDRVPIPCTHARRFGGVYNYEDYILQDYASSEESRRSYSYAKKAGDAVLVAFLDGNSRGGIIIGGITHLARQSTIKPSDGPQYISEFNGVEKSINKDGELTLTFKGLPTNVADLKKAPTSSKISAPTYDVEVGSTYIKFDKTGGWTISDNAKEKPQSIFVDKSSGKITITSGNLILSMDKASEHLSLSSKLLTIDSSDNVGITTKAFRVDGSESIKLSGSKIAIGSGGVELLEQISKLVDAIGSLTIITPIGPASPVSSSPQWSSASGVKASLDSIKGSL